MPSHRRPSSKDVAAMAGVSQSTVSYVMSGARPISEQTRQKVERAMRQLGYVPDAHAQAMISNRSHIIGLITETTENTQGAELFPLLHAVQDAAQIHGYDIILVSPKNDIADMSRLARAKLVDAFIIMDIRHHDERLAAAGELGIPVVPFGDSGAPYAFRNVAYDQRTIIDLAFREMHDIGARIAVPVADARGGTKGFPFLDVYERRFRECANDYGIQLEPFDAPDTYWQSFEPLTRLFPKWKGQGVCLYVRSSRALSWIEHMMLLSDIEPGRDIGLIGECSDHFAQIQPVPITNVSPEARTAGRRAVEIAVASIDAALSDVEPPKTGIEFIPPRFTRRATTMPGFAGA